MQAKSVSSVLIVSHAVYYKMVILLLFSTQYMYMSKKHARM